MSFLNGTDPSQPQDPVQQAQDLAKRQQILGMLLQGGGQGLGGAIGNIAMAAAMKNNQNQQQNLHAQTFQGPQQNGAMPPAPASGLMASLSSKLGGGQPPSP